MDTGALPAAFSASEFVAAPGEAEIEVGTERFKVRASPIARGPERDRLYEAHGANFAPFKDYPKKTTRIIPVVVLERAT